MNTTRLRQQAATEFAHARSNVLIAMLHRFSADPNTDDCIEPSRFERELRHLKDRGWRFARLCDVADALARSERLPPTLVITVDDGYSDFVELGVPALANAGSPATVFATSGFLDGSIWFWWDQLEYILARGRGPVTVTLGGRSVVVGTDGLASTGQPLAEELKRVPDQELRSTLRQLADLHGVAVPSTAPEQYRPTSWSALRSVASAGFDVGPHTLTHPILSQVDGQQAHAELSDSWTRVRDEMGAAAAAVACYPNGTSWSFGDREVAIAVSCGLTSGVTATHETPLIANAAGADMFRIPRFHWSARLLQMAEHPRLFGAGDTTYRLARRLRHGPPVDV